MTAIGFVGSAIHEPIDGPQRREAGIVVGLRIGVEGTLSSAAKDEVDARRRRVWGRLMVEGGITSSSVVSPSSAEST